MVKILQVEDNPAYVRLAENQLKKRLPRFRMQVVNNKIDLVAELAELQPDVVISGYNPAGFIGMPALKTVQQLFPCTPVIIFTGWANEHVALECMNEGAADIVFREHDRRLGLSVLIALRQKEFKHPIEQEEKRSLEIPGLPGLHQSILGSAGLSIVATSSDRLIRLFNPAAEKLLGYMAAEVTGKSTPILFYDPEELKSRVHDLSLRTGEHLAPEHYFDLLVSLFNTYTDECHFIRKDGSRLPVRVTISAYTDRQGQQQGYILIFRDITSEAVAMEALRRSEERFQAMFLDHAAVMLLVSPDDGRIIQANRAARQFYGYSFSPEEHLNLGDINQTDPEEFQAQMQEAKDTHKNCFIFPHRLASGETRTVEVHSSPIEVAGEKVLFSIIHDITERKITEERLVKSELENRAILNALPDTLYKIDNRGVYQYAHCTDNHKSSFHQEQFLGRSIHEILPEQVASLSAGMLQKAIESRETVTFEYSLPAENGLSYFENRMVALTDSEVLSMVRDITRKTLAIQATQRNELFLKMMTVNSPIAFMVVDNISGDIIFYNPKFCEMWGICDPAQPVDIHLKHKTFADQSQHLVQDPESYAQLVESLGHIDERAEVKETIAMKDGKYLFMHSAQIRSPKDEYYGRLFIFEDITEKEQLTNSLKEAIAREQKISRVKSSFVTMASHEFRTPIAAILMASETLLNYYERMNRNDLNKYLLKINHNIQFLREIVDKFLDLSKIETGKIPFSPEILSLSEFMSHWHEKYISRHNLNHNLMIRHETLRADVHADKQLMLQVLDNLVSNCIKYSPENTDVVIQAECSGEQVIISIADQGMGIPADDQEKLFQTFFRASNTRHVQGTGLGLPLCKQVIEQHQGHIWIKSALNEGTTVYFSLPLIPSANGNGSHETEYYMPYADPSENRL